MRKLIVIVQQDEKEWRAEERMEMKEDLWEAAKKNPVVLVKAIEGMEERLTQKITEAWTNR